jgi:hypothetical protein
VVEWFIQQIFVDLNIGSEHLKTTRKRYREKLHGIGLNNDFSDMTPKA